MKRVADVAIAVTASLLLMPLVLIIAAAVWMIMGGPVLYRQQRPGLGGKPFTLIKFRTMTNQRGSDGSLLPDSRRLTCFGRWLRRTSLDELPELLNVVRGDMSLVGPRPLLMEYIPLYSARQSRRHDVKPGLTGWAQIHGRNGLSWEERLEFDVWYVEHHSPMLDMQILWRTLGKVLRGEGVSQPGQATSERFRGSGQ